MYPKAAEDSGPDSRKGNSASSAVLIYWVLGTLTVIYKTPTIRINWVKVFTAADQQEGKGLFSHRIYPPFKVFMKRRVEIWFQRIANEDAGRSSRRAAIESRRELPSYSCLKQVSPEVRFLSESAGLVWFVCSLCAVGLPQDKKKKRKGEKD